MNVPSTVMPTLVFKMWVSDFIDFYSWGAFDNTSSIFLRVCSFHLVPFTSWVHGLPCSGAFRRHSPALSCSGGVRALIAHTPELG